MKNKLLNSYAAVREAAKERQVATYPEKGQKGFQSNAAQLVGEHQESQSLNKNTSKHAAETNAIRAKAAGTNRQYINMADKLLKEEPEVFAQVQKGEKHLTESPVSQLIDALGEPSLRNKLLNSYAAVREAAKQRELSGKGPDGSGGRGNKKNLPLQIAEGLETPTEIRELRAKAAGTNKEHIGLSRQAEFNFCAHKFFVRNVTLRRYM